MVIVSNVWDENWVFYKQNKNKNYVCSYILHTTLFLIINKIFQFLKI